MLTRSHWQVFFHLAEDLKLAPPNYAESDVILWYKVLRIIQLLDAVSKRFAIQSCRRSLASISQLAGKKQLRLHNIRAASVIANCEHVRALK
jgi:hypothetical protein